MHYRHKEHRHDSAAWLWLTAGVLAIGLVAVSLCSCATASSTNGAWNASTRGDPYSERTFDYIDVSADHRVTVGETGWNAKDGFVHYGIMVSNAFDDAAARDTQITVTLYDAADNQMWTGTRTVALIGPDQTVGISGTAGDGNVPARVEFTVREDTTKWTAAADYTAPTTLSDLNEVDKLYFRYELVGKVTNNSDAYVSTIEINIIYRDDSGAIVAGYLGDAYRIKSTQMKDFLVTMNAVPDHASYEVYAQMTE